MFKSDAVNHFGTNTKVALAAGVDRSAVSQWKLLVTHLFWCRPT
ncbi:Cro/CI family transcriptional regulator [Enterobacter sp. 214E4]